MMTPQERVVRDLLHGDNRDLRLGLAVGLVAELQQLAKKDSFRADIGVPDEVPADETLTFYTGFDYALDMALDMMRQLHKLDTVTPETVKRMLDVLAGETDG